MHDAVLRKLDSFSPTSTCNKRRKPQTQFTATATTTSTGTRRKPQGLPHKPQTPPWPESGSTNNHGQNHSHSHSNNDCHQPQVTSHKKINHSSKSQPQVAARLQSQQRSLKPRHFILKNNIH